METEFAPNAMAASKFRLLVCSGLARGGKRRREGDVVNRCDGGVPDGLNKESLKEGPFYEPAVTVLGVSLSVAAPSHREEGQRTPSLSSSIFCVLHPHELPRMGSEHVECGIQQNSSSTAIAKRNWSKLCTIDV